MACVISNTSIAANVPQTMRSAVESSGPLGVRETTDEAAERPRRGTRILLTRLRQRGSRRGRSFEAVEAGLGRGGAREGRLVAAAGRWKNVAVSAGGSGCDNVADCGGGDEGRGTLTITPTCPRYCR